MCVYFKSKCKTKQTNLSSEKYDGLKYGRRRRRVHSQLQHRCTERCILYINIFMLQKQLCDISVHSILKGPCPYTIYKLFWEIKH